MLKISRHPISLDRPVGESEDSYFGDFIEDDSIESPVSAATNEMLKDKIEKVVRTIAEARIAYGGRGDMSRVQKTPAG